MRSRLTPFARLFLLLVLGGAAAFPGGASAQEEGVFVDPDSPAGTEYAIPVEEARREASGDPDGKDSTGAPRQAPLFGAGIKSEKRGDGGAGGGDREPREPEPTSSSRPIDANRVAAASTAPDPPGDSDELPFVVAALVLGGGLAAGHLIRRRTG